MAAIGPEQQRLTPFDRANLVAYLDGELNEAEKRALSTKLTASPTARREIEVLEKTWELLEYLPRPKVADDFADRTLSQIRLKAERGELIESNLKGFSARFARASLWVLLSLAAAAVAFFVVNWAIPNPSDRLARELPVVEHLDELQDVKDIQFLNDLIRSTEFNEAGPSSVRPVAAP